VGSSDTDYFEGEALVPSCDVVLDNTKTLSYNSGSTDDLSKSETKGKDRDWKVFKSEIVRLAHTLRLKGWRSVPLDRGAEIEVERLSGALTNAVYVVSPPKDIRIARQHETETTAPVPTKAPP
jgi:choline kinase